VFDGLKVAIDCANGAAYKVGPEALEELGPKSSRLALSRRQEHQPQLRRGTSRRDSPNRSARAL